MAMYKVSELISLANQALENHGAVPAQAMPTAIALVNADAQGLPSHGVSRVPMYCAHLKHKRVIGNAEPKIINQSAAALLISAENGFAFPACNLAVSSAVAKARESGSTVAAVNNSHHFGAAGLLLEEVGNAGMVGIVMGNSPAAMPFAGGAKPILGTNPLAAIFPVANDKPIVIDLSMSEVARGKIMIAQKNNQPIPLGWALDNKGNPTTDANEALKGAMLPFGAGGGGNKGYLLALLIELLLISLSGCSFGAEADSFFEDEGNQPKIGQLFLIINPAAFAGKEKYYERIKSLISAILSDGGRIPGARRYSLCAKANQEGIAIPDQLYQKIVELSKN